MAMSEMSALGGSSCQQAPPGRATKRTGQRGRARAATLLIAALIGPAAGGHASPERPKWHGEALGIPDYRLPEETFFRTSSRFLKGRKVYAWYMPCTAVFPSWDAAPVEQREENFIAEIQMAQSMGIDGFGLDIMDTNENYHRSIEAMFRAAKRLKTGFKLFFEFDYGRPTLEDRAQDIVMLLKHYSGHEAYETVDGRPLVSAYAPDGWVTESGKPSYAGSAKCWRENVMLPLRAANLELFFVPATFRQIWSGDGNGETSRDEIATWGDAVQGLSMWQIQLSPIGGGLNVLERQAQALHTAQKTWMTTVAMHYWCGAGQSVPSWYWQPDKPAAPNCVNGTYFEHAGGKGLDAQWRSVIDVQKSESVMMLTWNDYNESYFLPVDDLRKFHNGTAQAPLGWYKSMAGLDELNRYFIQWYKTGVEPEITADTLFYSYRTSSYKLTASADPRPPVKIGNPPIGDDIYLTAALTAPAQVQVVSGPDKKRFDVPAGMTHFVVPFQIGPQAFSLWRDGREIAGGQGEPIVDKVEFYDFWPTTGLIRARN